MTFCSQCGTKNGGSGFCPNCGTQVGTSTASMQPQFAQQTFPNTFGPPIQSKKTLAGVLGILLGGLGIHKFVLGYTTEGILTILITILTCGIGAIIGLVEGIIYLTKSDEEFIQTYQVNRRGWF